MMEKSNYIPPGIYFVLIVFILSLFLSRFVWVLEFEKMYLW